ncbi:peroxiredoxin [Empedobacter stercoris]|uniref:peroxiredoxin n=1 Tax=Empedobacter stercoris TaxID=1628248 RepID=UPI0016625D42|nr:peroxiredoxin [Empedobacter stercoris]MCA4809680.1 peroxiredoxin [Empedobacter stercoris]QNT14710.1 peroxiredoxin [Empedobacter stercoris]
MKIGDHIPTFSLEDNKGNWFNSDEFLYKKYFVLFFYPMDFTPMCTKEVCQFRDVNADFKALDTVVVGINGQSTSSHEKFYTKHQLNFPLLSDKGAKLTKLLGIKKKLGLITPRETFVFNKQGKLIKHIVSNTADLHIVEAMNAIKKDQGN